MENDLTGVGDLFNKSIYRIPDYQRGTLGRKKKYKIFGKTWKYYQKIEYITVE